MGIEVRVSSELAHLRQRLWALKGDRSQKRWSRELGIPQQTVNRWLLGRGVPGVEHLIRVSLVERVCVEWLILGVGPMERER